jgi:hypothetical protein
MFNFQVKVQVIFSFLEKAFSPSGEVIPGHKHVAVYGIHIHLGII